MSLSKDVSEKIFFIVNNKIRIREITNIYRTILSFKREIEYPIKKKPYYFPYLFQIQTVNQCNGSCLMCPNKKIKSKKPEKMSDELFKKIIQEIVKESKTTLVLLYLQNEPLIDDELFQKIKLIKKLSNDVIATSFITNGVLFNDKKIKELIESKNDYVYFSIDAFTEETYNRIRQGLDFKKLQFNIDKILNTSYKKNVYVEFVVQRDNILEYKKFVQYWKKKKVPVLVNYITNRSGDLDDYNELSLKNVEISKVQRLKSLLYKKIIKCCHIPLSCFNILYNGDVILCCNDYSHKLVLGNVKTQSIKEIWNSKKYQEIRRLLYEGSYEKIPVCRNCSTLMEKN